MIKINITSLLTPEEHEKLEDELRNFLESRRVGAEIYNSATGNNTRTRG
jgi:hypothetical protein